MPDRPGPEPSGPEVDAGRPAGRPAAVVVLAAGEGTRMRSTLPKVLHPIGGRSLLGHAVHAVAALEPEQLVVVVGAAGEQVAAAVEALATEVGRPIVVAVQEQRLGTGHAVRCGLAALPAPPSGPVLVTYGDVPLLQTSTLASLLDAHTADAPALSLLTTRLADPTGYGRVLRESDGTVTRIVEQTDATAEQLAVQEINSGVYAFDGAFLTGAIDRLGTRNSQHEQYLTDLVAIAHGDELDVRGVPCADHWQVSGVNDRVQLAALRAELNRRLLEHWMRAGITVVDPATTWLDVQVTCEPDALLQPGVQLLGRTTVGRGAEIGPDTTLRSCTVGAGAVVVRTHGSEAQIGPQASVGPFAYLRPGARLGERSKVGTFVEVKNSEIGTGTKVPHLTYVGDATIGEHSNIGASSVFVNYDGERKQRSVIGSHVRTGSDNTFVAPVHIGDGAYTGAGAVIREDVPPGALAVSAGHQRNLEGWVARRRPGSAAALAATDPTPSTTGSSTTDRSTTNGVHDATTEATSR